MNLLIFNHKFEISVACLDTNILPDFRFLSAPAKNPSLKKTDHIATTSRNPSAQKGRVRKEIETKSRVAEKRRKKSEKKENKAWTRFQFISHELLMLLSL